MYDEYIVLLVRPPFTSVTVAHITARLCGRVQNSFPDPMIVSKLPFTKSIFRQIRRTFKIHDSIFRVINRNTSCAFRRTPNLWKEYLGKLQLPGRSLDILEHLLSKMIVYNCRSASTWPGDVALSVTFCLQTSTTWAVVYGCNDHTFETLTAQLVRLDYDTFHPMALPTLFADLERARQVDLLRLSVSNMLQRIYDLTVNKDQLAADNSLSALSKPGGEDSVMMWIDMSYLRNGLQNWQKQLQNMMEHVDELANDAHPLKSTGSFRTDTANVDKSNTIDNKFGLRLKASGVRVRERLRDLIDEYDEHIRECSTLIQGLNAATSMVRILFHPSRARLSSVRLEIELHQEIKNSNQEISSTNLEVSRMAQRDGSLVKAIALLTMIFLPATFVSVSVQI